jgi:DNA-binding CsgD family transcriptional regulator
VGASHDIWPEEEMVKSPAYQGFYGPRNWHYGIGGVFFRTPATVSLITSIREKEKGPYGEQELGLLRTLVPHLRRAALLHSELNSLRSQHAAFASQLDRSPQALLLTDADRRILFTNAPGRAITKVKDGLRVELNQLRASSSTEDATLAKSIREVAANGKWRVDHLTVARPSGGTPYVVLVMPVPSFGAPLGMPPPAVAVMVTDPDRPVSLDPKALQVLFSFTPAEAKVTALLVQGRSMEQIATQLAVSLETVRTHVRHVFSKTATNRQGELIALVLRMAPSGPESADDSSKMCI